MERTRREERDRREREDQDVYLFYSSIYHIEGRFREVKYSRLTTLESNLRILVVKGEVKEQLSKVRSSIHEYSPLEPFC